MRRVASIGALKEYFKTEFKVGDVFYTSWGELSPKQKVEVYTLWLRMKSMVDSRWSMDEASGSTVPPEGGEGGLEYGVLMLLIMRQLRKNQRVIDQMNEAQVLDCFNELKVFLDGAWYGFINLTPTLSKGEGAMQTPAEKMATSTFDHFIYADNEFSLFLIKKDDVHLKRLVATLYQKTFDKEAVEGIASRLKLNEWQLLHVFYTYKHVREYVMSRCKTLMPPPQVNPSTGEPETQNTPPTPTGAMWLKLKHRLAETPAFAGFDVAGKANMYSALDYLEDLARMAREKEMKRG